MNLNEVIRRRGALPVEEACDYIRQTAEGLEHAHRLGMVHRDIKPHNLMLTTGGEVKILDFGLAAFATEMPEDEGIKGSSAEPSETRPRTGQLTELGTMMGTPDFVAPEQAQDAHSADIRADIYSLGCTFYTLLAGEPPFGGGSLHEKLAAHSQREPEPLSHFRNDVPSEVEAVLRRMLAKDPTARYQTPAEVVAALTAPKAPPVQPAVAKRKPAPRTRPPLRVVLATIGALLGGLLAAVVFYIQTDYGLVRVEVADPELEVAISGSTITVHDGDTPISIRAGEKTLTIRRADFQFDTDSFLLRRGEDILLNVSVVEGAIVVEKNGEPFAARNLPKAQAGGEDLLAIKGRLEGHTGPVKDLAYSPNGRWIASASGYQQGDKTARIWDAATGELLHTLPSTHQVMNVAFSPDSRYLATAAWSGEVTLWSVAEGKRVRTVASGIGQANAIAFSHDGGVLFASNGSNRVFRSEVETGKPLDPLDCGDAKILRLAVTADGEHLIAAARDSRVFVWQLDTAELLRSFPKVGSSNRSGVGLALLPGGELLVGDGSGVMQRWDWRNTRLLHTAAVEKEMQSITVDAEGHFAYLGCGDSMAVFVLDLTTWKSTKFPTAQRGATFATALSPNGSELISGGGAYWDNAWKNTDDYAIRVWRVAEPNASDAASAGEINLLGRLEGHRGSGMGSTALAASQDGRIFISAGGVDRTARFWNGETG